MSHRCRILITNKLEAFEPVCIQTFFTSPGIIILFHKMHRHWLGWLRVDERGLTAISLSLVTPRSGDLEIQETPPCPGYVPSPERGKELECAGFCTGAGGNSDTVGNLHLSPAEGNGRFAQNGAWLWLAGLSNAILPMAEHRYPGPAGAGFGTSGGSRVGYTGTILPSRAELR